MGRFRWIFEISPKACWRIYPVSSVSDYVDFVNLKIKGRLDVKLLSHRPTRVACTTRKPPNPPKKRNVTTKKTPASPNSSSPPQKKKKHKKSLLFAFPPAPLSTAAVFPPVRPSVFPGDSERSATWPRHGQLRAMPVEGDAESPVALVRALERWWVGEGLGSIGCFGCFLVFRVCLGRILDFFQFSWAS